MKPLRTAALLVCLAHAAASAHAQTGNYPARHAILPLPPVDPATSQLVPAGYSYRYYDAPADATDAATMPTLAEPAPKPRPPEKFQSSFTTGSQAHDDASPSHASSDSTQPANQPESASPWSDYEHKLRSTGWEDCDTCETGDSYGGDCYGDACCLDDCGCGPGFFASVGGLVMTRARANAVITTVQNGDPTNALMNTQDAGAGWTGGGEVSFGYAFGGTNWAGPYGACGVCGNPGLVFTWWGTGEMTGFSSVTDTTGVAGTALNSEFNVAGVTIGGDPASNFFEGASRQRLWRTDNINSFEGNLLQGAIADTGRLQIIGLAGFRYFRFTEVLTFGSTNFAGTDEAFLSYRAFNNLYGGQVGGILNYSLTPRCSLYITPKAGVYGNQMVVRRLIYRDDGISNPTISAYKSDVSFLGQIDTGINYMIRPNVFAYIGYRIVGVSNVALGDNQFGPALGDDVSATEVKQSGSLILHGATFGLSFLH